MNSFNSTVDQVGTICVIRVVSGEVVALTIGEQRWYTEWTGCFTLIK